MLRAFVFTLFAGLLLAAPLASAHTTVDTADSKYFVTVGNLNEPVTTFTKTGLDLSIRANVSGQRGAGISGLHLTLDATLLAPNGEELTQPLEPRFGAVGGYSFEEPYYLTVPGEYHLRLTGMINETEVDFDGILVGSGPIPAFEATTFPDEVQSMKQLQARIAALEAENEGIRAELDSQEDSADSPAFDAAATVALLGVAVLVLARRRGA